jgi:hypothetical protein
MAQTPDERRVFYVREWLNLDEFQSSAHIIATIDREKEGVDLELKIADCHRSITLDLNTWDEESAFNVLHKLDVLVETLVAFRRVARREIRAGVTRRERARRQREHEREEKRARGEPVTRMEELLDL